MLNLWEGYDAYATRYDGGKHFRSISIYYWTLDAILSRQYDESGHIDEEHTSLRSISIGAFKSFFRPYHC